MMVVDTEVGGTAAPAMATLDPHRASGTVNRT